MITLTPSVSASFSQFASPPTHALCTTVDAAYIPIDGGLKMLHANYHYGTLDSDGNFILNQYLPVIDIRVPDVGRNPDTTDEFTMLSNLYSAGVVPDPSNPVNSLSVPSKKAFNFKMQDVDAVIAYIVPGLNGTVV